MDHHRHLLLTRHHVTLRYLIFRAPRRDARARRRMNAAIGEDIDLILMPTPIHMLMRDEMRGVERMPNARAEMDARSTRAPERHATRRHVMRAG